MEEASLCSPRGICLVCCVELRRNRMNKKFSVLCDALSSPPPLLLVPPPRSAAVRKCNESLPLLSKAGQDRLPALTRPLKSLTGQGFERAEEAPSVLCGLSRSSARSVRAIL